MNARTDETALLAAQMAEDKPAVGISPAPKPATPSAPIGLPPPNTLDPTYLAHRNDLEGRAALASQLSEDPPRKLNATEQSIVDTTQGRHPGTQEDLGVTPPVRLGVPADAYRAVGKVVKDIGIGATEIPRQALLEGPRNALQSMLDGASDLGKWLEKQTGAGGIKYNIPGLPGYDKDQPAGLSLIGGKELAALHRPGEGSALPDFGQPTTVTGGVAQAAGQFITSMATLGRVFGPMGTDIEGTLGHLATAGKSAAALFAGFEKASGNLADLIEKVPALSNPVTRFLASKPDDNEAEGRLRNALTGVGFGELQNGILKSLGMLRAGLAAKTQIAELPETPVAAGEGTAQTPAAFKFLGDPDAPPTEPLASFRTVSEAEKTARAATATEGMTPEQVAAMKAPAAEGEGAGPRVPGAAEAQAKEPQVYVNFARIDTPDDVKRTLSQLADVQKDNIDAARRGIQTFEGTKLGADFTDAWQTLMDRRVGQPLNAEEQLAGRQLLAQSAMKVQGLTESVLANPNPTAEDLFAWRKSMQTHAMIQAEVSGSQAEVARSLSAMRIPVSGQEAVDRMAALTQQLDQMGGMRSNLDFLRATKALIDGGRLEDLGNVAEKSAYATTRDALLTGWTNGLLTNPLTHVKVNLSNIATIGLRLLETRFAEGMDKLTDYDGVPAGEAAQTTVGLIGGIKDSLRYIAKVSGLTESGPEGSPTEYAARAFKSGHYSVGEAGGIDWAQAGQESGNALAIADSGWAGKATDLMSSIVTSPGRALAGEHEFYRALGMRMELQRFAFRKAMDELNAGKIADDALAGRIAQLVETPTPQITANSISGMTYQTFTDAPGKFAETIGNLREQYPLVRVVLPFYKIPARILSFSFERTPFAPLMAGWQADVAAGGARQSLALAKTGLGSMVMLAASDAVLNGTITGGGPKDKTQRQALLDTGWLPYSVKTPNGRWVQYNRLETVGSSMAMAADLTEGIRDYYTAVNTDDPNVEKLTAAGIATLANAVTSKTYLEGLARFFDTISDPRANAEATLKSLAGSALPAGVAAVAGLTDPYQRATYSMIDALKARTPGVSETLPPVMNRWGEPVRHDSGLGKAYDALVPFASRRPLDEPIDRELMAEGMHLPAPAAKTSFGRGALVDLRQDPATYARYLQLAGNELKLPGPGGEVGLKDRLNALVSGSDPMSTIYEKLQGGSDGGKEVMLRGIAEQYNRAARSQLLSENKPLADLVQAAQERHQALRLFTENQQ